MEEPELMYIPMEHSEKLILEQHQYVDQFSRESS